MSYTAAGAERLDVYREESLRNESRASLRTLAGQGADAKVRAGVSAEFIAKFKVFLVVLAVIGSLCVVRVGTFAAAATILQSNSSMRAELKEARETTENLRVQRSVLSTSSRIDRIATQSYGMVAAGEAEQMTAGAAAAAAESEQAAQGDEASSADDQATDEQATDEQDASEGEAKSSDEVAADISQAQQTEGDGSTAGANAVDMDSLL